MKRQILLYALSTVVAHLCAQRGPQLIGMTYAGGTNGNGTIFQYTGGETSLQAVFNFPFNPYYAGPVNSTLTQARNGKIYGLNIANGDSDLGSLLIYDYNTDTAAVVASFDKSTGYQPYSWLLLADDSILYGLNDLGGANKGGTLFSYAPGSDSVIKLIDLPANAFPTGSLIQASNGNLYGMTTADGTNGGGTIFQYNISSNTYTVQINLPKNAGPYGSLLEVGADTLYGLTRGDGINSGGTLFRYVAGTTTDTVLENLDIEAKPQGALIHATDGRLYGLTFSDGAYGFGTLFSYDINLGSYTDLHDFNYVDDGTNPGTDLLQASDGMLYGMTEQGGIGNTGIIFQYNIKSNTYTIELALGGATGTVPARGHLTEIAPPVILTGPASQAVCAGSNVSFGASVQGIYTGVQWQVSTDSGISYNLLPGDTGTTISFTATSVQNGYRYRAIFTNISPSDTSMAAVLTVNPGPVSLTWDSLEKSGIEQDGIVCANLNPEFKLKGGSPPGGVYTGTGVSGDTLYSYNDVTIGLDTITYTVIQGGCIASSSDTLFVTICTGIDEVKSENVILLYPNPVTDMLVVQCNLFTASEIAPLIYDITGKLITCAGCTKQGTQLIFNTVNLSPGIYFIQINVAGNEVAKRFVKVD